MPNFVVPVFKFWASAKSIVIPTQNLYISWMFQSMFLLKTRALKALVRRSHTLKAFVLFLLQRFNLCYCTNSRVLKASVFPKPYFHKKTQIFSKLPSLFPQPDHNFDEFIILAQPPPPPPPGAKSYF